MQDIPTDIPYIITPDGDFRVVITVEQMKGMIEKSSDPTDVLGLTYIMPEHVRQFLRHAFFPPFVSSQHVEKAEEKMEEPKV